MLIVCYCKNIITCNIIYMTGWTKTNRFRTFPELHFIESLLSIATKEWTAKVSAFYDEWFGVIFGTAINSICIATIQQMNYRYSQLTTETSYKDGTWLNLCIMNWQIYQGIVFSLYSSVLTKKVIPTKKRQ